MAKRIRVTIRIDREVYEAMAAEAKPFETPNDVLRRKFGLSDPTLSNPYRKGTQAWDITEAVRSLGSVFTVKEVIDNVKRVPKLTEKRVRSHLDDMVQQGMLTKNNGKYTKV